MRDSATAAILLPMFVRRAKTRTTENGDTYYAYRLVRSERRADMDPAPGGVRKMVVDATATLQKTGM